MIRKHGNLKDLEPNEPPVEKGFVRIYEFLHGYEDITEEEYEKQYNSTEVKILEDEIRKEIDKEIISIIAKNSRA